MWAENAVVLNLGRRRNVFIQKHYISLIAYNVSYYGERFLLLYPSVKTYMLNILLLLWINHKPTAMPGKNIENKIEIKNKITP
jgi:hypothetical protein